MKRKQTYVLIGLVSSVLLIGVIAVLVLASSQKDSDSSVASPTYTEPRQDSDVNFVLHVLSSSKVDSIDIKVYIDGRLEIDDNFESEGSSLISIIPHKTFRFQLERGTHVIKAVSNAGEATLEEPFEIVDEHWAIVGYEYWSGTGSETPPKQFEFVFQDDPIRFQ